MTAEEIRWVRANYGARVEIDVTFSGGESLQIGSRRLEVAARARSLRRPPGRCSSRETGLLFSSDAVHWHACPAADGSPALCPTYEEVDDYLGDDRPGRVAGAFGDALRPLADAQRRAR